jgi:histidinol phosphatase-like enzyme
LTEVSKAGIMIDKIYFCPHSKAENCSCRKPEIGLILRARDDLNIDLSHSYFIGDSEVDIKTGLKAGMKTIFINNELAFDPSMPEVEADFVAKDLLEAAHIILQQEQEIT